MKVHDPGPGGRGCCQRGEDGSSGAMGQVFMAGCQGSRKDFEEESSLEIEVELWCDCSLTGCENPATQTVSPLLTWVFVLGLCHPVSVIHSTLPRQHCMVAQRLVRFMAGFSSRPFIGVALRLWLQSFFHPRDPTGTPTQDRRGRLVIRVADAPPPLS